ncbi:plant/protein [Perilla frutescens var. frutescens]|nr:plant/protein [Perilla frutescens var. frutescens]
MLEKNYSEIGLSTSEATREKLPAKAPDLGPPLRQLRRRWESGGVARYAEGVDEGGGEDVLMEAIGAALAIEAGQNEADGGEVVGAVLGAVEGVEKLAEFGALDGRRLALLHPVEHAHHHIELRFRHFYYLSVS